MDLDRRRRSSSATDGTVVRNVAPVMQRTITGAACVGNTRAVAWSPLCGLVATGSNSLVVVSDPLTLQNVQVLEKHRSNVIQVAWLVSPTSKHAADRLTLASADATGHVVVWNAKTGETKAVLRDGSRPVADMKWLDGRYENTGHLLAALHPPFALNLWDTATGTAVWKKTYTETLQGFDFDPFDATRLAFRCIECILFVDDFSPQRAPSSTGQKFYVLGPSRASPSRTPYDLGTPAGTPAGTPGPLHEDKGKATRTKIKKIMKDLVMGEFHPHESQSQTLSDCVQVLHHQSVRNHLLLVYPKEILILDLDIGQTVGILPMERTAAPIWQVYPCRNRDAMYILTQSGTLSLRVRKKLYAVAATPSEPFRNLSKSVSTSSIGSSALGGDAVSDALALDNVLEIAYEQKAHSEGIRLQKHAKILGMAVDNIRENSVAIFTSDGRLILVDIATAAAQPDRIAYSMADLLPPTLSLGAGDTSTGSSALKLFTRGIVSGLSLPPFLIRMCPPLTMKNLSEYIPFMAIAGQSGNIQIANMSTGKIERDFAVHTYPVRGLEWTSLTTILSHAHQNLSSTSSATLVRNELIHTDVRTGKTRSLRSHCSEEPAIAMLRVSHLKQYFIVAFLGAPFELWDLRTMTLLRTMPKKFPPITALDWSPLHNLKSLKRKMNAMDEKENKEGDPESAKEEGGGKRSPTAIVAKEHFVFTDAEGQLYHFSVEGNTIRDGTKVPAESSLGSITCIAWKSDHIVRGDSDGNINVWDVKTRTSRNIATNRGSIRKIRFAPGRGNLKILILNPDSVSIWDVKECELINELRTPKDMVQVVDVEWAASDRPVLATIDGCLRVMGLALASASSAMYDYNVDESAACHALLSNKERTNLQILLHHQPWKESYALTFSTEEDGLGEAHMDFVHEQMAFLPEDVRAVLLDPATSMVQRGLIASQVCGMKWEADFWRLAQSILNPEEFGPADTCFDLASDSQSYLRLSQEKITLHQSRCSSHTQRRRVVDLLICLNQKEEAVRLLLETEPGNPNYYEDSLKACLVASTSVAEKDTPHSTTKLVATNLIAEGKTWEGVQLLCLIDKVVDACNYLQSCGQWDASLWLAKTRLADPDLAKVASKYCDHLLAKDLKKQAVMIYLSLKDFVSTLDCLVNAKMIALAAQCLEACQERKLLPDTSHMMVLTEEISLAYARHLFDCGNLPGAFYYCDKADEKGEILRRELEMVSKSSKPTLDEDQSQVPGEPAEEAPPEE